MEAETRIPSRDELQSKQRECECLGFRVRRNSVEEREKEILPEEEEEGGGRRRECERKTVRIVLLESLTTLKKLPQKVTNLLLM